MSTHTLVQLCGQPLGSAVIYQQEDSLIDWKDKRLEREGKKNRLKKEMSELG